MHALEEAIGCGEVFVQDIDDGRLLCVVQAAGLRLGGHTTGFDRPLLEDSVTLW